MTARYFRPSEHQIILHNYILQHDGCFAADDKTGLEPMCLGAYLWTGGMDLISEIDDDTYDECREVLSLFLKVHFHTQSGTFRRLMNYAYDRVHDVGLTRWLLGPENFGFW